MAEQTEQQMLEGLLQARAVQAEISTEAQGEALAELESEEIEEDEEEEMELEEEAEVDYALDDAQNEIGRVFEEGRSIGNTSYIYKYIFVFYPLAILCDLSAFLILIPYAGFVLSWIVSFFFSGLLIYFFWLLNSQYKDARGYLDTLESKLSNIEHRINSINKGVRRTLAVSRGLRKVPGMKGVSRAIPRLLVNARKPLKPVLTLLRSPMVKVVAGAAPKIIPILNALPFSTISVILSMLDERHMYRNVRKEVKEVASSYDTSLSEA